MTPYFVIPVADVSPDSDRYLHALLRSIIDGEHEPPECFLLYDQCQDGFAYHFKNLYPQFTHLENKARRLGFTRNVNRALTLAFDDHKSALVINQDCVLPHASHMEMLYQAKGVASPDQITLPGEIEDITFDKIVCDPTGAVDHTKITGFCMFYSADVLQKIGLKDPYFPDAFEDDDVCARALLGGYPVQTISKLNVHHAVSKCGAVKDLGLPLLKFRAKWAIAPQVEHSNFNSWIKENHVWQDSMRITY